MAKLNAEGADAPGAGVIEAERTAAEQPLAASADNEQRLIQLLDPELLGDVSVELDALLGKGSMSLSRLASLKDGTVVGLDLPLNGQVDLALNGRIVARGELVAVGDNFGVRITEVLARKS